MTVKNILSMSATFLGRDDIVEFLKSGFSENVKSAQRDTDMLLRCFNIVENEIALEYKPVIACENMFTEDGIVNFEFLTKQIIDVIKVLDENDNKISYKLFNTYLKTKPENIAVYYSYVPDKKQMEGESSYKENEMPSRVIALGVACEFCLISSMFDEAVLWDKRYKDALNKICIKKISKTMPVRRWI